jgi:hypothetical protein
LLRIANQIKLKHDSAGFARRIMFELRSFNF